MLISVLQTLASSTRLALLLCGAGHGRNLKSVKSEYDALDDKSYSSLVNIESFISCYLSCWKVPLVAKYCFTVISSRPHIFQASASQCGEKVVKGGSNVPQDLD